MQHTVLSVAGLKGAMSEAELHVLYARMRGGILSKARRGELAVRLPVGLVYDDKGEVILDPDAQVQQTLRLLFAAFGREGSAWAAVKSIRKQKLLFPKRLFCGPRKGDLLWVELDYCQAVAILRSPRYAGAYVFGRTRIRKKAERNIQVGSQPAERAMAHLTSECPPGLYLMGGIRSESAAA